MNIQNIALVRATNVIPFDGVVHPISEVPYLRKERGTAFAYAVNDLLREKAIINEDDYWTKSEEEQEEMDRQNKEILEQYLPYNSDYNSMVLWSLNGLVPDDINNTFSNKSCAIIEGLAEQIDTSEVISLVPTDTAIKGNVKLSQNATILISSARYETLTQEEKAQLESLGVTIKVFDGSLEEAVDETLETTDRYVPEKLSLTRKDKGYLESDTSEELIETIRDIAESRGIPQELFFNILTGQNNSRAALTSVEDEHRNMLTVEECYKKTFFQYLFLNMDIDRKVATNIWGYMESPVYAKALCQEIERIGLDKYKEVVGRYNATLRSLQKEGELPTPEQIVNQAKEEPDFNLATLIEKREKQKSNFSIQAIQKIDETVTVRERKMGVERLKENLQEVQENLKITEENKGDSRI